MSQEIISKIKENVIQGRKTQADEGIDDGYSGTSGVQELTRAAIEANIAPNEIVNEALTAGMQVVGEKFETKEYFIPDMLASAEAVEVSMDILKPLLADANIKPKGKFAIATVKGDIHDIGKNIVAIMLKGAGYEVVDLGIDVTTEKIINYIKNESPDYLGLSALLTTTMLEMGTIIEALKKENLRDKVKVFIGGAAVSDEYAEEIGADAFCLDAFSAIKILDASV
ncbi:MAG: corrinoid protein [Chloroflexi bacterium]|jgi:5-methyltetrahydrofolate--homocysteine methyltransferase|nr:corrinoid protein [Chloroflexota bacterium]MBT7080271.1 corrinoid protein [Chloroflexota bacterium]MBT7289628.1 corrinoid protein [Chloroflexota bacterium]